MPPVLLRDKVSEIVLVGKLTAPRELIGRLPDAWASARRLPDAEAELIRQAIVPAVPTLSGTWWSDFNDKISTAIARATATPGPALAALP